MLLVDAEGPQGEDGRKYSFEAFPLSLPKVEKVAAEVKDESVDH